MERNVGEEVAVGTDKQPMVVAPAATVAVATVAAAMVVEGVVVATVAAQVADEDSRTAAGTDSTGRWSPPRNPFLPPATFHLAAVAEEVGEVEQLACAIRRV